MAYDPYENVHNPYIKKWLMFFNDLPDEGKFPLPYTADPELKTIVDEMASHLKSVVTKQFKMPSPEMEIKYQSSNSKRYEMGAFVQMHIHVVQDYGDLRLDVFCPFHINRKGYAHAATINFEWFYMNEERPILGGEGECSGAEWSADATGEMPKLYKQFRKSVQEGYTHKAKQIRELNRAMALDVTNSHGIDINNGKRFGWQLITLKRFMKAYKIQPPVI